MNRIKLPRKILDHIGDNLEIEWAGRRAAYEFFEELADCLWWEGNLWLGAFFVHWYWGSTYQMWAAMLFFSVVLAIPFMWEMYKWLAEVYVVAKDTQATGGEIYKFTGVFNLKKQSVPITPRGPVVFVDEYENNLLYSLWVRLTGERMQKVQLKSEANVYFVNNRLPPEFDAAITTVKGSKPDNLKVETQNVWEDVREVIRTTKQQFLDDSLGHSLVEELVKRHFYG